MVKLSAMMRMQRNIQHQSKSWFGHTGSVKKKPIILIFPKPDGLSQAAPIRPSDCGIWKKDVPRWLGSAQRQSIPWTMAESTTSSPAAQKWRCMIGFRVKSSNIYGYVTRCLSVALSPGPGLSATDKPWCGIPSLPQAIPRIPQIRARGLQPFQQVAPTERFDLMDLCTIFFVVAGDVPSVPCDRWCDKVGWHLHKVSMFWLGCGKNPGEQPG